MTQLSPRLIDRLLMAVGDLLAADGTEVALVVVGGASLSVMGLIPRVTFDVDVIARAEMRDGTWVPIGPHPLPEELVRAVRTVARDFSLAEDWLNAAVGDQWPQGLPEGMAEGLTWKEYGALHVGFAGRQALLALKLFAAVDQGPKSVHFQDLVLLDPTRQELDQAKAWVLTQDAGIEFPNLVHQTVEAVDEQLERS